MKTTRVELFEMVWETPMIHLAKQLNLSDVGLRNVCKKHGIPLPRAGHWTRHQLGKADPRPELPYPNHNPTISFPDEAQAQQNKLLSARVSFLRKVTKPEARNRSFSCVSSTSALTDLGWPLVSIFFTLVGLRQQKQP